MVKLCLFVALLVVGAPMVKSRSVCQRSLTYEEVQDLLAHSPCAMDVHEENGTRVKRDQNSDSSSHVFALQATMNDHRTIIDDHRTMINYLMNNSVNVTQLSQHFAEQHSKSGPIWRSWRDVSLVFLAIICVSMLIYLLVIHIRPLELLTSFLLRRHQVKATEKKTKKNMVRALPSDLELDSVSTIDRTQLRY